MSADRMGQALTLAAEYRRHCDRGDMVLAGEARRTIDDLVGHSPRPGVVLYPRAIAEAMGVPHLTVQT